MKGEKKQGEGRKLRAYRETVRQSRCQNKLFPTAIEDKEKDNIYRRCDAWERDCFQKKKKKLENIPQKISLIFIRVFYLLKIVFRSLFFFFFGATKHWKMWKTIYIESFPMKQTERKCILPPLKWIVCPTITFN